jgi:hypothetical protein
MGPYLKKTRRPLVFAFLAFFLVWAQGHRPLAETAGPASAGSAEAAKKKAGNARILVLGFTGSPPPWKDLTFPRIKRHTTYTIKEDRDGEYLFAVSSGSASALYLPLDMDPGEYPVLSWRWKIGGVLRKGDARTKAGDDYAARVYVTFARDRGAETLLEKTEALVAEKVFGQSVPGSSLNYIWANRLEKGAILPNTYTARNMMIAVESGGTKAGLWVREERNIIEDYMKAFGRRPPRITGIAVMTDSDNTGEEARAWYRDIVLKKGPGGFR